MTLTNDPFADSAQVAQNSADGSDGSEPSGSGPTGAKAAGSGGVLGEVKAMAKLTPPQREARLAELGQLIDAAETSQEEELRSLYNEQALLCFEAQDYAAAVAAWDRSLDLEPAQEKILYNRGIALDRQGLHELALESYDKVIELNHGNHIAWGNRAIALRKLGRAEEAKEAARIAFELNPTDMVDSFFEQLTLKQPRLGFVWKPLKGLVQRLRR